MKFNYVPDTIPEISCAKRGGIFHLLMARKKMTEDNPAFMEQQKR